MLISLAGCPHKQSAAWHAGFELQLRQLSACDNLNATSKAKALNAPARIRQDIQSKQCMSVQASGRFYPRETNRLYDKDGIIPELENVFGANLECLRLKGRQGQAASDLACLSIQDQVGLALPKYSNQASQMLPAELMSPLPCSDAVTGSSSF